MFTSFSDIADLVLFCSCVIILLGCTYLTFRLRFIQLRFFPSLFGRLINSIRGNDDDSKHTIPPHKALFTAMSTTLGISTIVAPVIAINLGGPGALIGFLLTSFLGSAATFIEVNLAIQHRKKMADGSIMGGPMQYLRAIFSPTAAKWYAISCLILMTAWSGAQANQIAAILNSPLLGSFRIPIEVSGACIAILALIVLLGGIKRLGTISTALVPIMFVLYIGSSLWIILCNLDKLSPAFVEIISSAFRPQPLATGAMVGGIIAALRWGTFKGIQACEAGIGTQAIPHSMSATKDPFEQATLAMLSTYTAGAVAFLSGIVSLVTETWKDPSLPLGISMVARSFEMYFSSIGIAIIAFTTLLFAFGTVLGNCYNGSQCFGYLTNNKKLSWYFAGASIVVFIGAISDVKTFWSVIDIILACMAVPHVAALVSFAARSRTVEEAYSK